MEPVSMNDGLEGREPIAFGLAAGELALFVGALMTAYVLVQTGLPGALRWGAATLVTMVGSLLAWGRLGGRPFADWLVLLVHYTLRTQARRRAEVAAALGRVLAVARRRPPQAGALVLPLPLQRHRPAAAQADEPGAAGTAGAHVVTFFSLNGGSGRTTLAVELARLLAARSAAESAAGGPPWGVGLVDLTWRNPAVALRLGLPLPPLSARAPAGAVELARHDNGLRVFTGPISERSVAEVVETAEAAGCRVVVLDVDCDLGTVCRAALERCDRVLVTLTPDAGGVLDAYRSSAALRRMGLRGRVDYVVNRCRCPVDLTETMGDVRGRLLVQVPEQAALAVPGGAGDVAGRTRAAVHSALELLAGDVGAGAGLAVRRSRDGTAG